jgi:hypothetical protein
MPAWALFIIGLTIELNVTAAPEVGAAVAKVQLTWLGRFQIQKSARHHPAWGSPWPS